MRKPAKRAYHSPLREKQTEDTRERIIEAISVQLTKSGLKDFSVAEIAKRAGVAERTVFRYFPTREDLLRSVEEAWRRKMNPDGETIASLEDILPSIRKGYQQFEDNKDLIEATLVSELGRSANEWMRRRRLEATVDFMRPLLPHLDPDELRIRTFVIRILYGYTGWRFLTRDCGLGQEDVIKGTEWALGLLLEDSIAADKRAAEKPKRRGTKK